MAKRCRETELQLLIGRLGVLLVLLYSAAGACIFVFIDTWEDRAHFGNMFGAVNALFTGMALAGAIGAIYLQQRDLDSTRASLQEQLSLLRQESERRQRISLKRTQLLIEEVTSTRTEEGNARLINRGKTATNVTILAHREGVESDLLKRVAIWSRGQEVTLYGPRSSWGGVLAVKYLDASALERICHLKSAGVEPLEDFSRIHEVDLSSKSATYRSLNNSTEGK